MNKAVRKLSIGLSLMVLLSLFAATTPALAGGPCCDVQVDFTAEPTTGYAPLEVDFDDLSECGSGAFGFGRIDSVLRTLNTIPSEEWEQTWDFGDGATDSRRVCFDSPDVDQFDVTHTYTQPGTYTVSLSYQYVDSCSLSILPTSFWNSLRSQDYPAETKTRTLYITVLEPREKWDRPLEPAKMSVSYLDIAPTQVHLNQVVRISGNVCNQGEEDGTKTVTLMVNGHAEQSQTVGVSGGSCKLVVFSVSKALPGTYQVSVDGMQGQFSVLGPPRIVLADTAPPQQDTGLGTAGILAIVVVGIVLIIALVLILKKE